MITNKNVKKEKMSLPVSDGSKNKTPKNKKVSLRARRVIPKYAYRGDQNLCEFERIKEELEELSRQLGKMTLIESLDYLGRNGLTVIDDGTKEYYDLHLAFPIKNAILDCLAYEFHGKGPYVNVRNAVQAEFDVDDMDLEDLVNQLVAEGKLVITESGMLELSGSEVPYV